MKSYDLSDPKIRANPALLRSLEAAKPLLEEAIGEPAGRMDARWRMDADAQGRPVLILKVGDWTRPEGIEREFAPDELRSRAQLDRRFRDLWLAFLFDENRRIIDKLLALPVDGVAS